MYYISKLPYIIILVSLLIGCKKEAVIVDPIIIYPTDILFEDFEIGRFQHKIFDEPFKVKLATFNVNHSGGDWSGFAVSNRNYRNYVADISLVDSTRFSVYTNIVHAGGNFLVAKTDRDDAFVTFDRPIQVEKVLVANTTQVWQTYTYGIGTASVGFTFAPNGRALAVARREYAKIVATGYLDDNEVGKVEFLLADRNSNIDQPKNFTIIDWMPMNLSSLGKVNKILFQFDTNNMTGNTVHIPPYFCLDGFRFAENI